MASSSKGSTFLTFHGKKYDPTFDWHDEDGLLQGPRTHTPYYHVDTKMDLNPWAGCERYVEYERALELNGHQMLFKCGHGRYWYLGDRVLPQVEHEYPPTTIPTPPCHTVRLADEKIARACNGYNVAGVEGNYSEFLQLYL